MRHFAGIWGTVVAVVVGLNIEAAVAGDALTIRGSDPVITVVAELAEAYQQKTGQAVNVEGVATENPTACLGQGVDLVFLSRDLSTEEADAGVVAITFAYDAMVVIVNQNNPITDMTFEQLTEIFSGQRAVWSDGQSILVVTQTAQAGDEQAQQDYAQAAQAGDNPSTLNKVGDAASAIAIVPFGRATDEARFKRVSIDGVAPTVENMRSMDYKLTRTLNLASQVEMSNAAKSFVDFVLSEEGQRIVSEAGLVSETVSSQAQ